MITLEKLARVMINLKKMKIAVHRKQAVWAGLSFLFIASMHEDPCIRERLL